MRRLATKSMMRVLALLLCTVLAGCGGGSGGSSAGGSSAAPQPVVVAPQQNATARQLQPGEVIVPAQPVKTSAPLPDMHPPLYVLPKRSDARFDGLLAPASLPAGTG